MSEKSKVCQYRKSKFMAGTISALAFSIATNSVAFAGDIRTTDDLAAIRNNLSETYSLTTNLDLAGVEVGGAVWTYIQGTFTGTFNGNGHTISNLAAPLFDVIGDGTSTGGVLNVGLKTTSGGIIGDASGNTVGVLAGTLNVGSTVAGVAVSGSISTVSEDVAGGLVGVASGEIINSTASVSISTEDSGGTRGVVGGLVGEASGASIANSNSTGSISSTSGNTYAGGLVGQAGYSVITNSTSSSTVTIGSVSNELAGGAVGGLVGNAFITEISNSSATGAITNVNGASATGGLVGNGYAVAITGAVASGAVTSSSSYTGGLLGKGDFEVAIIGSSATGSVTVRAAGATLRNIGGLVGGGEGFTVFDSSAEGNVSVTAETKVQIIDGEEEIELGIVQYVGGLIGAGNVVMDSTASGSVTVSATDQASYIGGLAGYYEGDPIDTTNASGNVTVSAGQNAQDIGGLVGWANGVSNSSASGAVVVAVASGDVAEVGGLAGQIQYEEVANSSASGSVSVSASNFSGEIGGLVGNSRSSIVNSSASGDVLVSESGSGSINEGVGGLVGWITDSAVRNSSASGDVSALGAEGVGGLAGGFFNGEIENSEARGDVSGLRDVGGLAGYFYGVILDSVSDGSATENGFEIYELTGNDDLSTDSEPGAIQGLIGPVGPTSSPDPVTEIDSGAELLDTENDPLAWGEDQYVNGGLPYLLALRESGYYTDTTPTGSPVISVGSPELFYNTRLYRYLSGESAIRIDVSDFTALGVRVVNERNLPFVMALLKENHPIFLSLSMINDNVKKADIQLRNTYRLFQYLNGDTKITLKVSDFSEFGVSGVTEANLPILVKMLKAVDPVTLNLKLLNKAVRVANLELKKMRIALINNARK